MLLTWVRRKEKIVNTHTHVPTLPALPMGEAQPLFPAPEICSDLWSGEGERLFMGGALSSSTSQVSLPQAEGALSPSRGVAMPKKGLAGMQEKRRNQVGGRGSA